MNIDAAKWRKATDVERAFSTFELVVDGLVLLDVGFSNERVLEVAFHEGIIGTIISWKQFQDLVDDGRSLAVQDM